MRRKLSLGGFTLIELIITLVLMAIIGSVISRFLFQSYTAISSAQDISETTLPAIISLERMCNDIHSLNIAANLTSMQASQLQFTNGSGNTILYALSSNKLTRNGIILAANVQALQFAYLDKTGSVTATASQVQSIKMTLQIKQNNILTTLSTTAALRYLT